MSEMAMLMKVGNSGLPCFPKCVARKNIGERFGICCLAANIQAVAALRRREDEMPPFIIAVLGRDIQVADNFRLAAAVTREWCRAQKDDAGRCRWVPDNREMVGWKIRVRSERPTPSAEPDDSARVAQRQRLQHIGRGIQGCGAGIPARNPRDHRFQTLWRNSPNASRAASPSHLSYEAFFGVERSCLSRDERSARVSSGLPRGEAQSIAPYWCQLPGFIGFAGPSGACSRVASSTWRGRDG